MEVNQNRQQLLLKFKEWQARGLIDSYHDYRLHRWGVFKGVSVTYWDPDVMNYNGKQGDYRWLGIRDTRCSTRIARAIATMYRRIYKAKYG